MDELFPLSRVLLLVLFKFAVLGTYICRTLVQRKRAQYALCSLLERWHKRSTCVMTVLITQFNKINHISNGEA
ncbi:hypothetical protein JOM56_000474 [Amanita muscaria]